MTGLMKFWMVYGFGLGGPTVRHGSRESAVKEANRLAEVSPGNTFVVLASVDAYQAQKPTTTRVPIVKPDPDEIPF